MASGSPDQVHAGDARAPSPSPRDHVAYPARGASPRRSGSRDAPVSRQPMDAPAPEGPPFKLWVGGFRLETQQDQVRDAFGRFGKITHCWIARNPPGFGYIEFDTMEEAQAAIDGMNGEMFDGEPLKVEFSRNRGPRKPRRDFGDRGGRGGYRGGDRGGDRGGYRGGYGGDRGGDRGGYGGDRGGYGGDRGGYGGDRAGDRGGYSGGRGGYGGDRGGYGGDRAGDRGGYSGGRGGYGGDRGGDRGGYGGDRGGYGGDRGGYSGGRGGYGGDRGGYGGGAPPAAPAQ